MFSEPSSGRLQSRRQRRLPSLPESQRAEMPGGTPPRQDRIADARRYPHREALHDAAEGIALGARLLYKFHHFPSLPVIQHPNSYRPGCGALPGRDRLYQSERRKYPQFSNAGKISMPFRAKICLQTAPAAQGAVSRPEKCPPPQDQPHPGSGSCRCNLRGSALALCAPARNPLAWHQCFQ